MDTAQPTRLTHFHWLLLGLLQLGAGSACQPRITATAPDWPPLLPRNPFVVRNYGGKCLDFGAPPHVSGEPVFIYDCNGTAAQRVVPVEIDSNPAGLHQVVLYAGDKVIGVMGNALSQQAPLELQDYNGSPGQIFELDGDSIILAADRQLVVEVQHARGENLTPVVLGNRDLADAEFWEFTATDDANHRPTRGFVRISQDDNADGTRARLAFLESLRNAHPGTVIELDPNVAINLTDLERLEITEGVTIRGDRRGTRRGPEIHTARNDAAHVLFDIAGSGVRLTGLRLRGPSRSLDRGQVNRAIVAHAQHKTIMDHNELSDWPVAAVEVTGDGIRDHRDPRPENVRIVRNFIHHNPGNGLGYGVVTGGSGYASIEGNTFVYNRHAIAGDGTATSGYRAWFNLVLHDGPTYGNDIIQQDFDMHGTGDGGYGGIAGKYIEIARNTFLGGDRANFWLRGTPTDRAEFHHNVLVGLRSAAIKNWSDPGKLIVSDNRFTAPDPSRRLGVGDFDGDGKDDLFLATGAAWYYAPAGQAEWRYLNAQTDKIGTLLFGDFDADGRTDVFTQHDGSRWDVSWGGASRWEAINGSGPLLGDVAIGDFDGDRRADVFYANGHEWLVSFSGTGYFTHYALAIHRVADLRFGDFNNDGKTDVFGVVGDQWMVVYGGTQFWAPLRAKLSDSVSGLTVADFNGDGRADVARSISLFWQVSWGGTSDWKRLRADRRSLSSLPAIGRFDDARGADVLFWAPGNVLDIASGGAGATQTHSRQDMR